MKPIYQILIGITLIAVVAGALILSTKYLSKEIEVKEPDYSPGSRLDKIREGIRERQ